MVCSLDIANLLCAFYVYISISLSISRYCIRAFYHLLQTFTSLDIKSSEASGGEIRNGEHSDFEEESEEEDEDNLIDDVPVDENLFTGEDLDELEEQLNTLEE